MAVRAAPALDWTGATAPQSEAVIVTIASMTPVVPPLVNHVLPAPDSSSLLPTDTGTGYAS
jgi:hypothetical protein